MIVVHDQDTGETVKVVYAKSPHKRRGTMSPEDRERQHTDMVYHIGQLQRRNGLLQQRLDESQALVAKLMREALK